MEVWGGERADPEVWRRVQALAIAEGELGLHDYTLPTPEGWELDDSYGKGSATYRWIKSPDLGEAFVRLHAHAKTDAAEESFQAAKLLCTNNALGKGGFTRCVSEEPCSTSLRRPAPVLTFAGHHDGWLSSRAYLDAPKAVYCIELCARPEAAHLAARPDLGAFARGFQLRD
jgi:hypothetical protein